MSVILSLLVMIIAIYLIAIVTEDFFIVSLDKVATRLQMPSDVAGASLMAMGSSAPELAIATFAVLLGGSHAEVGIATIVGSAVFNVLIITGASALVAGSLVIEARSVQRDVVFYLISVGLLLFVFFDGSIVLWEVGVLLGAYAIYLLVLWRVGDSSPKEREETPTHAMDEQPASQMSLIQRLNFVTARLFRLIARDPEENYVWALSISIIAIAALSYLLVEAVVIFSDGIGLPAAIVSLTLLAAGTSAPDLLASMHVAREGRGNMAIANAVGSNIFDILIGLGVPWLIMLVFLQQEVFVETQGLTSSILVLSGTVILLYYFLTTGREFSRREGYILILAYAAFVLYEIIRL